MTLPADHSTTGNWITDDTPAGGHMQWLTWEELAHQQEKELARLRLFQARRPGRERDAQQGAMAPEQARGLAFGVYNAALGFGGLAASLIFGAIWTRVSPAAAFLTGACLALAASVLLYLFVSNAQDSRDQ